MSATYATKTGSDIGGHIADITKRLVQAGKEANVRVDPSYTTTVSQAGVTFVAASIAGVENIPATAYREGVNVGFAYYESPDDKCKPGYYTLRVRAKVTGLGDVDSTLEFVDQRGEVARTQRGKMNVFSLTVPENPPFTGVVIKARLKFDEEMRPREPGLALVPSVVPDTWCSNGTHHITFDDDIVTPG